MSLHRKAFLVWLTTMTLFVAIASTIGARIDPAQEFSGGVAQLIAAAEAHAESLRSTNAAEAERWRRMAAAAKAEARRFVP